MMQQYPGALVIQTHRDPLRVITSVSSLTRTLRTFASAETPLNAVAEEWAEYVIDGIDRSVDARECALIPRDQVVDVHFRSFSADPIPTIAAAYDRLGLDFTTAAETRMRSFLASQLAHEHGWHHYTFVDTGLDETALRARTARYQQYFGVENEPLE